MEKKILVAVDGSIYSSNSLHYITRLFSNDPSTRFHFLSLIPASGLPTGSDWMEEAELLNIMDKQTLGNLRTQKHYVKCAVQELVQKGFAEERLSMSVRLSHMGIVQDIIHEAKKGMYDALLIGRRGVGKIEELFAGSVSSDILDKCHQIPLWIIDGKVDSQKFLVPFDGTIHSMMAIDHLAHILSDNPLAEVTFFHSSALLAGRPKINPEEFYDRWDKEWCDKNLTRSDGLFHAPKQVMIDAGFPAERIFWLTTFKGFDPSRQILRQAIIDDFGTIVMGRRGGDVKKGIFKGVSDRVLYMAEQAAVWIVG